MKFYKHDTEPDKMWLNKEYLVQLNLTGKCPCHCEFCYIKDYTNQFLSLKQIQKLWINLRKYYDQKGISYRVNITGGDVFLHPEWKEIAKFLADEKSIEAVDPLLNRFWKEDHLELLKILKKKINFIQLNPDVVEDKDIEVANKINKQVVLKIALYRGSHKQNLTKIKSLLEKHDNIIVSIDHIIPQKCAPLSKNSVLLHNEELLKKEIDKLKSIFGDKLWLLSTKVKREYLNKIYYCPVPFGGVYIMPEGKIVPCSRYSHLNTGFTIDNFDLIDYVKKFNKLVSNFCLYENKYFTDFWKKEENPENFLLEVIKCKKD